MPNPVLTTSTDIAATRATIRRIAPVTTAADPARTEGAGADDTAKSVAAELNEDTSTS